MNAVRRSLLGNGGKDEGTEADPSQLSLILRRAIRTEKVELAPKRTVIDPVLCYELIENKIAFALVKALVDKHRDDLVLELLKLGFLPLLDRAPDQPEQGNTGNVISLWAPCPPVCVAQCLLPLPRCFQCHKPS
ncbi:hypothetical protein [Rhizobium arsenicireducens]